VEHAADTTGAPPAAGSKPPRPAVSVIIPTLDEEASLGATLDALAGLHVPFEVIVVDGGSRDRTLELAQSHGVRAFGAGRAATGDVLWFLHADTLPPADAPARITEALSDPAVVGGHFRLRFDGPRRAAHFLSGLQPLFTLMGLVYGDSGIFVRREEYERVGGFRPFPLFEDLDLVRRLRRRGRVVRVPATVIASSRRFAQGRSFTLLFARWVVLQLLYWLGVPPNTLARHYATVRRK
jgi:glycosyltransferase involved in cell wall biosynthesis